MFFNIFKSKSKTKNILSDTSSILCFKDLKNNLLEINDIDNYLSLQINGQICYLDKEQLKFLDEVFRRSINGESINSLVKILNNKEEE